MSVADIVISSVITIVIKGQLYHIHHIFHIRIQSRCCKLDQPILCHHMSPSRGLHRNRHSRHNLLVAGRPIRQMLRNFNMKIKSHILVTFQIIIVLQWATYTIHHRLVMHWQSTNKPQRTKPQRKFSTNEWNCLSLFTPNLAHKSCCTNELIYLIHFEDDADSTINR